MARPQEPRGARSARRKPAGAEIVPLPWVARRRPAPAARRPAPRDPDDYPISDRTLLTVAAFMALFIVGCVWLLETMRMNSILEDCLMAGRKNCTPIAAPVTER